MVKFSIYLNRPDSVMNSGAAPTTICSVRIWVLYLSVKHHSETHINKNTVMKQIIRLNGDLKPEHEKTTMSPTTGNEIKAPFFFVFFLFFFLFLLTNVIAGH